MLPRQVLKPEWVFPADKFTQNHSAFSFVSVPTEKAIHKAWETLASGDVALERQHVPFQTKGTDICLDPKDELESKDIPVTRRRGLTEEGSCFV